HLADRILIGPLPPRERLAYQRHMRGLGPVLVSEKSAAKQRDAQRAEISVAGHAVGGLAHASRVLFHAFPLRKICRGSLAVENQEFAVGKTIAASYGERSSHTDGFSAGNRAQPGQ